MDTFEDYYDEGKEPLYCWHRGSNKNECPFCKNDELQNKVETMKKALENIMDINTNGHQRGLPGWEIYERINNECAAAIKTTSDPTNLPPCQP